MPTQSTEGRPRAFLHLVVTPESIPQFTIPRLASSSRSPGPCPRAQGAAELYPGDLEPGTRLAMSLPHLRRVTTPYGFLALGESPCVGREESLFFGAPEEEGWGAVGSGGAPLTTPGASAAMDKTAQILQTTSPGVHAPPAEQFLHFSTLPETLSPALGGKPSRSFSWDLSSPNCRFRLGVPDGKTRLQRLIRKHLSRAQKKRRARGGSSSGGEEEESSSSSNGE